MGGKKHFGPKVDPEIERKRLKKEREELNRLALSHQLSGLKSARTILSAISQTSPTAGAALSVNPVRAL